METKIAVRPCKPEDVPFILSTWLKGALFGEPYFSLVPKEIFYKHYAAHITQILSSSEISVKIACLSDDEDIILGYSVHNADSVHWVYVKAPWRLQGIAKALVPNDVKYITNTSKPGRAIAIKKKLIHNPWRL